jgi:hypothetical protein
VVKERLVLLPLGLREGTAEDPIAQPGKHFAKKVKIAEGSTVVVESAPRGLIFDPVNNVLNWDVPADFPAGQAVDVIMLVKPRDGEEEYLIEKIRVP